jgi:hypothetical protein
VPNISNSMDMGPGRRRPRVFVDLTTSLSLLGQPSTGISRIEPEVARRLLEDPRVVAIPCVLSAGSLYALGPADALRLVEETPVREGSTAGPHETENEPILSATASDAVPAIHPTPPRMPVRAMLRRCARQTVAMMPASIREDVRLVLIRGRQIVRNTLLMRRITAVPGELPAVTEVPAVSDTNDTDCDQITRVSTAIHSRAFEIGWPEAGDVLWICRDYAATTPLAQIVEARRRFDFSCVAICYDLIEGERPEASRAELTSIVRDSLTADLLDGFDRILCISERTRKRLLDFAARSERDTPDARVIGGDALLAVSTLALPRELIGRRFALAVGPMEQRRNFGVLIRIWEDIADRPGFDLDLVLVAHGSEREVTAVREIEASPLLGRRIFWFENCTDEALGMMYRSACAVLYPNYAEGSHPPFLHGLASGIPVLTSHDWEIPERWAGIGASLSQRGEDGWREALVDLATSSPPRLPFVQQSNWDAAISAVVSHLIEVAQRRTE